MPFASLRLQPSFASLARPVAPSPGGMLARCPCLGLPVHGKCQLDSSAITALTDFTDVEGKRN